MQCAFAQEHVHSLRHATRRGCEVLPLQSTCTRRCRRRLQRRGEPTPRALAYERWRSLSREDTDAGVLCRAKAPPHGSRPRSSRITFAARTRRCRTRFRGATRTDPGRLSSSRSSPSLGESPFVSRAFCTTLLDEGRAPNSTRARVPASRQRGGPDSSWRRTATRGQARRRSPRDAFDGCLPLTSHGRARALSGEFRSLGSRRTRAKTAEEGRFHDGRLAEERWAMHDGARVLTGYAARFDPLATSRHPPKKDPVAAWPHAGTSTDRGRRLRTTRERRAGAATRGALIAKGLFSMLPRVRDTRGRELAAIDAR